MPIYTTAPSQISLLAEPTAQQYLPPFSPPLQDQNQAAMFTSPYPSQSYLPEYPYPASTAPSLPSHYGYVASLSSPPKERLDTDMRPVAGLLSKTPALGCTQCPQFFLPDPRRRAGKLEWYTAGRSRNVGSTAATGVNSLPSAISSGTNARSRGKRRRRRVQTAAPSLRGRQRGTVISYTTSAKRRTPTKFLSGERPSLQTSSITSSAARARQPRQRHFLVTNYFFLSSLLFSHLVQPLQHGNPYSLAVGLPL